jgi:hypothetical protein
MDLFVFSINIKVWFIELEYPSSFLIRIPPDPISSKSEFPTKAVISQFWVALFIRLALLGDAQFVDHFLHSFEGPKLTNSAAQPLYLPFISWIRRSSLTSWSEMSRRYDGRTTIFSPEGRLYQVEYAMEAISMAGTAIGVLATDGIVLAAEKKVTSKLLEQDSSDEKLYVLNEYGPIS